MSRTVKWVKRDLCPVVNPDTGVQCESFGGPDHVDDHVHAEWYLGEIQGPIYWPREETP